MALLQAQQQQKVQVGGGAANGVGSSICSKVQTSVAHGITSNSTTLFVPSLTHHHHHHHHLCRAGDDPVTLDLFQPKLSSIPVELEEPYPLPFGWQRFLHLKTGSIYYKKEINEKMSRNGANSKLDLRLNLSPPRRVGHAQAESSPNRSAASSPTSSCVSSEETEAETSMLLVGCPRCLMYVMLSEEDPRCPKCKSTVLLDFLHQQNNNNNNNTNNTNNNKTSKKN